MTQCPRCHAVKQESVRLWNGREYCRSCLRDYCAELEVHAVDCDTLRASPEIFARTIDWRRVNKRHSQRLALIAGGLFGVLAVFALATAEKDALPWPTAVMFGLLVFGIMYVFGRLHSMLLFSFGGLSPKKLMGAYPSVEIRDGKVSLTFKTANLGLLRRNPYGNGRDYTVDLDDVRLLRNEDCPDRRFRLPRSYADPGDLLWLDFSAVADTMETELNLRGLQAISFRKHPYMVCCSDPKLHPVWEAFFRIADGTAGLEPWNSRSCD